METAGKNADVGGGILPPIRLGESTAGGSKHASENTPPCPEIAVYLEEW